MGIISEEQIIKVMRQYNPWWKNPLSVKNESKPQKRLAYYEALNIIGQKRSEDFFCFQGQGESEKPLSCIKSLKS